METLFNYITENEIFIYLLLFTIILGFEVISKVPTILHTPLMSGANAISGIVVLWFAGLNHKYFFYELSY